MKVKEYYQEALDVFGDLNNYLLATDEDMVNEGDIVTLVNENCEFEFDNVRGCFENNLLHYFKVDLDLLECDYSNYDFNKSNNGGKYAFCTCKVLKVHYKSY